MAGGDDLEVTALEFYAGHETGPRGMIRYHGHGMGVKRDPRPDEVPWPDIVN